MANRIKYSAEELMKLREAIELLEKYKYSDVFGDISGTLQKVLDFIEINLGRESGESYDFISPEKQPHIKGSEYLAGIIEAIKSKKVLRLYYQPFYEDKPYYSDIHPYLLKEYKRRWYLIGLNDFKEQLRTYSLDRIRDIEESDIDYKQKQFSAAEYFKNSIGIISPPGEPPLIKIAIQKTQAQYVITQPWHESQNIDSETEEEVVFSFKLHPTYEFNSLLLSYGKDVRVIEPESLIELVKSQLEEMLGYYSGQ